jgi:hypothetical protein
MPEFSPNHNGPVTDTPQIDINNTTAKKTLDFENSEIRELNRQRLQIDELTERNIIHESEIEESKDVDLMHQMVS